MIKGIYDTVAPEKTITIKRNNIGKISKETEELIKQKNTPLNRGVH